MYNIIGFGLGIVILYIICSFFMYKEWRNDSRKEYSTKKDFFKRFWWWPAALLMVFGILIYLSVKECLVAYLQLKGKSTDV